MKKALALILAAMMVAGTASVALADVSFTDYNDTTKVYVADPEADNEDDASLVPMAGKTMEWGDSLFLALTVTPEGNRTEKEEAARYKAKAEWAVGADLVESVRITYRKQGGNYGYFVEVKTKENVTTSSQDLEGTVKVYRGSASNLDPDEKFNLKIENFKTAKYPSIKFVSTVEDADKETDDYTVYEIGNDEDHDDYAEVVSFEEDLGEITIVFDTVGEFDIDIAGEQSKLYLGFDRKVNNDILAKYGDGAELEFVNFRGNPTFNKTGLMHLYTTFEDGYVYAVNAEGKLEAVKATYDADYEAMNFAARTLASTYVLSDTELDLSAQDEATEGETTEGETNVKPNPGTGR